MTKSGITVGFMRVEFDEACRQTKYYYLYGALSEN